MIGARYVAEIVSLNIVQSARIIIYRYTAHEYRYFCFSWIFFLPFNILLRLAVLKVNIKDSCEIEEPDVCGFFVLTIKQSISVGVESWEATCNGRGVEGAC